MREPHADPRTVIPAKTAATHLTIGLLLLVFGWPLALHRVYFGDYRRAALTFVSYAILWDLFSFFIVILTAVDFAALLAKLAFHGDQAHAEADFPLVLVTGTVRRLQFASANIQAFLDLCSLDIGGSAYAVQRTSSGNPTTSAAPTEGASGSNGEHPGGLQFHPPSPDTLLQLLHLDAPGRSSAPAETSSSPSPVPSQASAIANGTEQAAVQMEDILDETVYLEEEEVEGGDAGSMDGAYVLVDLVEGAGTAPGS